MNITINNSTERISQVVTGRLAVRLSVGHLVGKQVNCLSSRGGKHGCRVAVLLTSIRSECLDEEIRIVLFNICMGDNFQLFCDQSAWNLCEQRQDNWQDKEKFPSFWSLSSSGSRNNSLFVYCQVQLKINSISLPWTPGA